MKYRIYIDEVGNPDLRSSNNPNHQFLSLTGVILELDYVAGVLHPQMEDLKLRFFRPHPDEPLIFHRKELVNSRHPFEILQDTQTRSRFDTELLSLLSTWDYTVVTVCLDKRKHKETYAIWQYHPYHYCLMLILERYVLFLERHTATGDVMAESRGGREDRKLKESFSGLWERGTEYVGSGRFQTRLTSRQLKVKPKALNIAGLQLADLLAHPSRNEILCEQGVHGVKVAPFARQIVGILSAKYDQVSGRIYGKKFL